MITALVDWIETQYTIDPQRIYLTGFSMGGYGTWALGLSSPDRFAALVPVAGGWESGSDAVPPNICDLASKPIWVFHGAQDETVKPAQSEVLVNALRACGSDVRFTLLPKTAHAASGVLPYTGSELYDWLLQQSLPDEKPAPSHGSPIESATPEVISTPLPGDGSLKPIGQHAYTIDLNHHRRERPDADRDDQLSAILTGRIRTRPAETVAARVVLAWFGRTGR